MRPQIRAAAIDDLPKLLPLAEEFYASSKFLKGFNIERFTEMWAQLIGQGAGVIYLAEADGAIAGTIGGVMYPDIYSGELVATEFFWFVCGESRGLHGMKLYRAFELWAIEQGCARIRMVHLLDSMPEKLKRIYDHLGFEAVEVHYTKEL